MSEKRDVTGACRSGFHWSKRSAKNPMLVSSNARANVKVVGKFLNRRFIARMKYLKSIHLPCRERGVPLDNLVNMS